MTLLPGKNSASVNIAVMTDIHYGDFVEGSNRRCDFGASLVSCGVDLCNQEICPDVVLILGDVVDDGSSTEAEVRWQLIRSHLDRLKAPYLAIPGNHDHDPARFYQVFKRPTEVEDIAGIRFLAFVDQQEPGYHASRSEDDLARIIRARDGYQGMLVACQHVCLHPDSQPLTPYRYLNSEQVIAAMESARVTLSISGHYHTGAALFEEGGISYLTAPGMIESPFPLLQVTSKNGKIQTRRHELDRLMQRS